MSTNRIKFKKIYSKIAFLIITIPLFVLVFKVLGDGISINNISIASTKIEKLYLKLNKKLVLDIENIILPASKKNNQQSIQISDIANIIKRAVTVSSFFERLNINNIEYNKEKTSIHFDGNEYEINAPYVMAKFSLTQSEDDVLLNIDTLKIKNENISFKGNILYLSNGNVFAFDIQNYINDKENEVINYKGQTNFKYLTVVVDSTKIQSIDSIAQYIKSMNDDAYEWIYEHSEFENVMIDHAYINIDDINAKNLDRKIVNGLHIDGEINNASLIIDYGLPQVYFNKIKVSFNDGKLKFKTKNAIYEDMKVDEGEVDLYDFLEPQTALNVNIKAKEAILDNRILNILKNYNVDLPIIQKDGITSGYIDLLMLLPHLNYELKITPRGEFDVLDSNVVIAGIDLFTEKANIKIDSNNIKVNDAHILMNDIADSIINAEINTDEKLIDLVSDNKQLSLSNGNMKILDVNNKSIHSIIDFKNDVSVEIPDYGVSVITGSTTNININDLSLLAPISPMLTMIDIKSGNLKIKTSDFNNISINGEIDNLNYPIYNVKNNEKIDSLIIEGNIDENGVNIQDLEKNLSVNVDSNLIILDTKNIMIDINELLDSDIPIFAFNDEGDSSNINVNFEGVNAKLFDYTIKLDEASLSTNDNGLVINGKKKNGMAKITYQNNTIDVEAENLDDDFVNTFFDKNIVSGGSFSINGKYRDGKFICEIGVLTASVKNMASLQNILTLIDTIPSLVAFKLPGFSASGYEIENAVINMGIDSEVVALENIDVKGSSVDIEGNGIIDLTKKDVNMDLKLSTMKSLSSILNKIPIIGYLILGSDGKITTDLRVTGPIEDPKTNISLLQDTVNAPVNILKRIFEPFRVLSDELKNDKKQRKNKNNDFVN